MPKIETKSAGEAMAISAHSIMQASGQIAGLAGSLMTICETAPEEVENCLEHYERAVRKFAELCRQFAVQVATMHHANAAAQHTHVGTA